MTGYTVQFDQINMEMTDQVGGKNASLGEMFQHLASKGIHIPDGFASTAKAYRKFLDANNIKEKLTQTLEKLDKKEFSNLHDIGEECRKIVLSAELPEELVQEIKQAYKTLNSKYDEDIQVAVRSSATAEDMPEASFAGQQETYLNIKNENELLKACVKCFASLFTDRAIKYREDNGFEHMQVALSIGVQKMVRADKASAGVGFSIDTETGFDKVVFLTGSWGLGENVVQGNVNPDEFYVFKQSLKYGKKAILSKNLGEKEHMMVYAESEGEETTINKDTPQDMQSQFVLSDEEIETVAKWTLDIEEYYERPMDIEWAKDGLSGELFIVQARPETVHSTKKEEKYNISTYKLKEKGHVLAEGRAIGSKIVSGKARRLKSIEEADKLQQGEVIVTDMTDPDWDPILKKAGAIVTNKGGRTSHAAIIAREIGAAAIVGTENGTEMIPDGQDVTISCVEGENGYVYEGKLEWEEQKINTQDVHMPETDVMFILADPDQAYKLSFLPNKGVGLMRLEFVINNTIKVHPMALVRFDSLEDQEAKSKIEKLTAGYDNKEDFFVDKLSQAIARIAAAFHPHDVIVRMSDFKTNEYANLLGGKQFEPPEDNPMLGFRGASRYHNPRYKDGFRLECRAMKLVREEMGFTNVKLMIPFCRTLNEGRKVLQTMEEFGLKQGENGLEIYVMVEIPSNALLADKFAEIFDGFSIGSNDLTQLTLGVDRDSEIVSELFDEKDDATKQLISMAIKKARDANIKVGLCGQAPSDHPEMAQFLVEQGISSISFNPDALIKGINNINEAEKKKEKAFS